MFYGYDRAGFPRPVPVGSAVRMVGQVVTADALADSEQLTINLRLEVDDVDERPACVANAIWRVYRIPS
jgi:acyl dehydratase